MESLLILSQVILSLQLPFAVIPLVKFTSSRRRMGPFANPVWVAVLAWLVAAAIVGLNAWLLTYQVADWRRQAGQHAGLITACAIVLSILLGLLILWLTFKPEAPHAELLSSAADDVFDAANNQVRSVKRIGVALEAVAGDAPMLADALTLAKAHSAELVLIHIVEGVGGQWYGEHTSDAESRSDDRFLSELANRIRVTWPEVRTVLGYGDVAKQIIKIARREKLDMLIIGGHGHRGLMDVFRGQTINGVRHGLTIPVLAVRK
jgi:manganese transport protein